MNLDGSGYALTLLLVGEQNFLYPKMCQDLKQVHLSAKVRFSEFQLNILESQSQISRKLFLSQKFLTPGQIVILAMAFGSGAIGNGRSLRNKKSLEEEV